MPAGFEIQVTLVRDEDQPIRFSRKRESRQEAVMSEEAVMSKGQPSDGARGNRLLGAMEASGLARIAPHLEPVVLKLGDVVCEAGGVLKHAYFPQGAVLSLLTVLENGSAIETANIGREGAFGLFAAMYSRVSFNRCLVQFEGGIVRCPIELLQSLSDSDDGRSGPEKKQPQHGGAC